MQPISSKKQSVIDSTPNQANLTSNMEVEGSSFISSAQKEAKAPSNEIEDEENLFELEIKNLDTNEVFKM